MIFVKSPLVKAVERKDRQHTVCTFREACEPRPSLRMLGHKDEDSLSRNLNVIFRLDVSDSMERSVRYQSRPMRCLIRRFRQSQAPTDVYREGLTDVHQETTSNPEFQIY